MIDVPVRDDLVALDDYHSPQVEVDVRLNTNESPYPPPAAWREAFVEAMATVSYNRYPDREAGALREAIAELHGVSAANVFAANGSNEVIQTLCLAYGGAGRRALAFEPTYALHSHIARLTGTGVVSGERGTDFTIDPEYAARTVRDVEPAIAFLCSPNNPTGTVDDPTVLSAVAGGAPGLVLVDEAYGQFAPRSAVSDVAESTKLVVTRTFSKTWSLAALRLGYCVAPRDVVVALDRVALPYHIDIAQQVAGRLALRFRDEMEARASALVEERERLAAGLAAVAVDQWPSGANFVLFRPRDRGGNEVWKELVERSVLVRNCSTWPRLEGCLRVTVGTPAEDDAFLAALGEVLS